MEQLYGGDINHKHFSFHVSGSERVMVLIHGIVEGPAQFGYLLSWARENGYSAVSLLLPGHGGSGKEFAASRMKQWRDHVRGCINLMRRQYRQVILVGHSMGGLLALQAALETPEQISGVFALALPLWFRVQYKGLLEGYKASSGRLNPEDESARAALEAYSIRNVRPLSYVRWIPRYMELFHLCHTLRGHLQEIIVPVAVVQSAKDEFISAKTQAEIDRLCPEWILESLPNSGHFYYSSKDKQEILRLLEDFMSTIIMPE